MTKYLSKWKCEICGWIGAEILKAANPFYPDEEIVGCPRCRSVETMDYACDEPDCTREATCGFSIEDGYRNTCFEHSILKEKNNDSGRMVRSMAKGQIRSQKQEG